MDLSLSPSTLSDVPLIAQLAEQIWRVHYTPIIGEKQVDYMLRKMYSEESLAVQMKEGQQFFIAYENGQVLGYISVTQKSESEFFLNKFYLATDQQGKGFGRKIFAGLLSRFPGLKIIRLQVNRMNFKTINFYFRIGFVIEEAKDFDIGEGYFMEDYVMVFKRDY